MSELLILIALAAAPCIVIALFIYWRDKFEKEPFNLVIWTFFGGIAAVVPPYFLTTGLEDIMLGEGAVNSFEMAIDAFICIALVEELSKYFFLRLIAYPNKNFNKPFDGIAYSVMISMGFALIENLLYVLSDSDNGIDIALKRMYTVVPAHAVFAVSMGYYVGLAKYQKHKKTYLITGLLAATMLHGFYDYFVMINNQSLIQAGAVVSILFSAVLVYRALVINKNGAPPATGVTEGGR